MTRDPGSIRKAGAVIVRGQRVLVVRKKGQPPGSEYIMAGGRLEPGETPRKALVREIREELATGIRSCEFIGTFVAESSLEGTPIVIYAYRVILDGEPIASSEIKEIRWITTDDLASVPVGSIMANQIMPRLFHAGIL